MLKTFALCKGGEKKIEHQNYM